MPSRSFAPFTPSVRARRARLRTASLAVAILTAGATWPRPARAQGGGGESAEQLFREAQSLLQSGREVAACNTFRASLSIERATGTLLHVARCHEQEGRLATALAEYEEVAERAASAGQKERASFASERARTLRDEVPRLRVSAAGLAPEVAAARWVVTVDATPVAGALAEGAPVDAGERVVVVREGERTLYSARRAFGPRERVVIEIVALEEPSSQVGRTATNAAPAGSSDDVGTPSAPRAVPQTEPLPIEHAENASPRASRLPAYVVTGLGGAAIATSAALGGLAWSLKRQSDDACSGTQCTPEGLEAYESSRDVARAATVAFVVGAVAVGVGVFLFVRTKKADGKRAAFGPPPLSFHF